jgi:antitoxin MazE
MSTEVAKWGNSLAVRIPAAAAREAGLEEGARVRIEVADGSVVIRPAGPQYSLDDLVCRITPRNRHREIDWGGPVGGEVW